MFVCYILCVCMNKVAKRSDTLSSLLPSQFKSEKNKERKKERKKEKLSLCEK